MRVLSDDDVAAVLDLEALLPAVAEAFRKQGRGAVERPDRPHFPVGNGLESAERHGIPSGEPLGTGLVMPAYIHGDSYYVTKLVGVHEHNAAIGLPTVNATIAVTDAANGLPVAYLAGSRITNARTGCIGGLAARELAVDGPVRLGLVGAGQQARWQARAIDAATDLERVRVYSPSNSRETCAADLRDLGIDAVAVDTPTAAVRDATVVVTATTATEPVFDGDDLCPGTLVVAVGAYTAETRELDDRTVERAADLFADVPDEAAETGDFPEIGPEKLVPLSSVLNGDAGRTDDTNVIVVASVGTAVLDAAAATLVVDRAREREVGRTVDL